MKNSLIRAIRTIPGEGNSHASRFHTLSVDISVSGLPRDAKTITLQLFTLTYELVSSRTISLSAKHRKRNFHFDLRYPPLFFMDSPFAVLSVDDTPWSLASLMLYDERIVAVNDQLHDAGDYPDESFLASQLCYRPCWNAYQKISVCCEFALRFLPFIRNLGKSAPSPLLVVGSGPDTRVLARDVLGMYLADDQPGRIRSATLSELRSGTVLWSELFAQQPERQVAVVELDDIDGRGITKEVLERLIDEAGAPMSDRVQMVLYTKTENLSLLQQYAPDMHRIFDTDHAMAYIGDDSEDEEANRAVADYLRGNETAEEKFDRLLRKLIDGDSGEQTAEAQAPAPTPAKLTAMERLNLMVGLNRVKDEVEAARIMALFGKERHALGIDADGENRNHMLFYGNPGTGKTTVAKLIGEMYHDMGLLSRGHTVEVSRSKLVGEYIGETEKKVEKFIEDARGGVLFVDEAYTLAIGKESKDYGQQVLNALLTVLSEPRPDMIVIFAGYEDKMQGLLQVNPGLLDRFPLKLHFDDYSAGQLCQIATDLFSRLHYELTPAASARLMQVMEQTVRQRDSHFGNGRWVHNLVEQGIVRALARRVMSAPAAERDARMLSTVEECDVAEAARQFCAEEKRLSPQHRRIGFAV